jgi:murein DD-endopeptidase MepM/ murein hydrolase activator NlpD
VLCVSSCESKTAVRGGGTLKVSGSKLSGVSTVVFTGGRGTRDDVEVQVDPASDRAIKLKVPMGAHSGPLMVCAGAHAQTKTKAVKIMPPPPPVKNAELSPSAGPADPGAPTLETGTSDTKYFSDERGGIEFKYRVGGGGAEGGSPIHAQVNLVRQNDGAVVQTWDNPSVAPGEIQSIRWDGKAGQDVAPEGRYMFLLSVTGSDGAVARSAGSSDPQRDAFDLWHFVFPVRGAHNYGQSGARFGAGRSGHSHQGQDVMSSCGTKLVAARGGVVKFKGYQGNAGNYLVIDAEGEDSDQAYMHLASPSPLDKGDRVYTNQFIGPVGQTGDATACHLHFEMWSAPGWYDGGAPFDPLPYLQAWDAYS